MDDLTELIPTLQNHVARPGTFATLFPETTDDMLTQCLLDGLAEVQLEGLLLNVDYDGDGMLDPEITNAQGALIALFAAIRLLRAELMNRVMHRRYQAGTAIFEEDYNVTLYNTILAQLVAQKDRVTADIIDGRTGDSIFEMADQFVRREHWYARAVGWSHPVNVW